MKKKFSMLTIALAASLGLVACGTGEGDKGTTTNGEAKIKVGMMTDSGTIDDKSFNQGTWEGIIEAEKNLGIEKNYMQPGGETEANYLTEIQNLYDAGYKFIVTPGFKFETAIYKAQEQYKDAQFVIIDGEPNDGKDNYVVGDNTVAIYFAEEQSGFAAGVAAAVELQTGDLGFIGGMEIPAVQKFNYGFQQGVAYANEHYGTNVTLKAENIGWGTAHFDLGKPEVNSFLISNVLYWFNEYHIDGIRVDAVSSMLYLDYDIGEWRPNKYGGRENLEAIDFLKRLNKIVYTTVNNPIIIAEESTAWPMVTGATYSGALGFTYKWNMGWMNDTLKYMEMDPIYRKHHHELITFSFMYAFSENFILPLSHDEVVHGKKSLLDKMPGDPWQKFASLRTLYAYYMMHPGKKLLFMGSEFGQGLEWRYAYGLEWELLEREPHMKMKDYVKDLNHLYKNEKALHEIDNTYEGFDFIDPHNSEQSIITLMRKGKNERDFIIAVINFTPVVRYNYKIGVPYEGVYEEVFNTDNEKYWGSNQTMESSELTSYPEKWHNKDNHIRIKVPPLGATFIKMKKRYKGNV